MRYWSSTPHHGQPILLIHGYGAMIEHWRRVMRPIARHHTMYALDMYGFGYSTVPRVAPSKYLWADQIATFVRTVVQQPVIIVGHSMGGMASAQFARDYPDLVQRLVLVNNTGLMPQEGATPSSPTDRLLFQMIRAPLMGEMLAGVLTQPWSVRNNLLRAYHRKEMVTDELVQTFYAPLRRPGAIPFYLSVSRNFQSFLLDIQPGEIQVPTLLLWGAEDWSLPPSFATTYREQMVPQADIQFIPESGHCPFDETPEAFYQALLSWVDQHATI